MKILQIQTNLNFNKYINNENKQYQNSIYNYNNINVDRVCFKGKQSGYNQTFSKLEARLQTELARLQECEQNIDNLNIDERLKIKADIAEKMADITDEYHSINVLLSSDTTRNINEKEDIALSFIEAMKHLGLDKGFNRILGYKDVKKFLKSKFIFSAILKDKIEKNVNVPDILLFYGPTNTGKSTFALALAEQSLSLPRIIDTEEYNLKDKAIIMDKIEEEAILSKVHYGQTNQRSIIIINEAENFLRDDDDVISRFIDFTKNCAEKYKCTVFLTTNFPKRIDPRILNSSVTPYKVAINPMEKDDCYELIKNKINMGKYKLNDNEIRILIDRLFADPNKRYSNGNISELFSIAWKRNHDAGLQEYLNILNSDNGEIVADIKQEELQDCLNFKKEFSKDSL